LLYIFQLCWDASPFSWWKTLEPKFSYVGFFGVLSLQIEMERIFCMASILISLKRCPLRIENMENLLLIYQNWPNDARLNCKTMKGFVSFLLQLKMFSWIIMNNCWLLQNIMRCMVSFHNMSLLIIIFIWTSLSDLCS
jgi:hypothetical protein